MVERGPHSNHSHVSLALHRVLAVLGGRDHWMPVRCWVLEPRDLWHLTFYGWRLMTYETESFSAVRVPVQGEIRHALVNVWNIDLSTSQSTPENFHRMTSHTFFWRNPLTFLCCGRICHDVCRFHCFINTVVFYFVLSLSFFQLSTTQHLGHTPPTLVGDGNAFCLPPRVTKMWWASDFEQASNWKQISWEWFNHQKMPANMQTSEIHN